MPPHRHTKSEKADKVAQWSALANKIEKEGVKMSPCTNCVKKGRQCIVSNESRRCSECTRRGIKCDVFSPSPGEWELLRKEEERLEREMTAAMAQAQEAFAKQLRLVQQQKLLKTRGGEMLRRGLATLDELDEAEEKDRQEAAKQAESSTVSLATIGDLPDIFDSLSPSFWQGLDVVDGMPATASGS
jgi:hypothetical protein